MRNNEKDYFDYSVLFLITNVIAMLILFGLSIYFIVVYIKSTILKIFLSIIAFPICVEFEYHCLIRIINPVVDFLIPKKWKQAKAEWFASRKQQAKAERIAKSRAESKLKN